MTHIKYKTIECRGCDYGNICETLNELGVDGWEIVSHQVVQTPIDDCYYDYHYFVMKKEQDILEEECEIVQEEDWQEHCKTIAKLAREVRELLEAEE